MDATKLTISSQDPTSLDTYLDHLSALRVSYLNLPTEKASAILRALPPEYADLVQSIMQEFTDREASLTTEISTAEADIKRLVLLTGASAHGTYLQATLNAPRVTWDNKALQVYSTLHPEILPYRKVGEPSVTIRARTMRKA